MNAIKFLLNEHDKVRKTFDDIAKGTHQEETKKKLFAELCNDLIRHEKMEQTVWYPRLKNDEKLNAIIKHLISEEKEAAAAIKQFDNSATEEEWNKQFKGIKKDVEHHASEEESKLFPKVEKIVDEAELEKIGKDMLEFKREYNNP